MDPKDMTEKQLLDAIRNEFMLRERHEAKTTRAISPVEASAPERRDWPSEEVTWAVIGGVAAIISLLCVWISLL